MKSTGWKLLLIAVVMAMVGCQAPAPPKEVKPAASNQVLHAHFYNSGFSLADDNYNACFYASNGKVYYVLASGSVDTGAQMFSFDPAT